MASDDQEKTEEASQSRRDEFRKKGQVAHSRELASALFLLVAAGSVVMLSKFFFQQMADIFHYSFGADMVAAVRGGDITSALKLAGFKFMILTAPILGIAFIVGVGSTVVQIGLLNVEDALTLNLEKISPLQGFKRIFSLKTVVETIKSILKLIFIGSIGVLIVKAEIFKLPGIIEFTAEQLIQYLGAMTVKLMGGVGMAMMVLTAGDYFFQRWDLEKKMMMSKQEVKDENKQREGDPLIKARIRRVQREMANRRMMEKVPTADVIITNPTHIAVALKYDKDLPAPQVIAKGADLIAEKIKMIAKEHNIPVVENKPLARTIFKTLKLGQVIPRELFVAVAEVLSYVYRLRRKVKR
ncbi:MAG: flagellar biosynthesis protein FlhB [Bdellovibrio sp. CG10_big_fil_rev_8_21_14_0_10_47_8]|nr:MAG: flagellar biosynthesis protein FlhB [Bdellovibrio sp. CG10_big_fil_rev_8_21_14_0_10_47_8]